MTKDALRFFCVPPRKRTGRNESWLRLVMEGKQCYVFHF